MLHFYKVPADILEEVRSVHSAMSLLTKSRTPDNACNIFQFTETDGGGFNWEVETEIFTISTYVQESFPFKDEKGSFYLFIEITILPFVTQPSENVM